jgi:trans-aconitate methyltransferase
MHPVDKQKAVERYNRRLQEFGVDPRTLGWSGGRERQDLRFEVLLGSALFATSPVKSVLDVGCGFADLYDYIQKQNLPIHYRGVDINSSLLEKARSVYPQVSVETADILEEGALQSVDLVVESGIFNFQLKGEDQWDYIEHMLKRMFELAQVAVAADFMTTYVDWQKEGAFHTNPEKLLKLAKSIGSKVILRHDYLPFEFCLYLIR